MARQQPTDINAMFAGGWHAITTQVAVANLALRHESCHMLAANKVDVMEITGDFEMFTDSRVEPRGSFCTTVFLWNLDDSADVFRRSRPQSRSIIPPTCCFDFLTHRRNTQPSTTVALLACQTSNVQIFASRRRRFRRVRRR